MQNVDYESITEQCLLVWLSNHSTSLILCLTIAFSFNRRGEEAWHGKVAGVAALQGEALERQPTSLEADSVATVRAG